MQWRRFLVMSGGGGTKYRGTEGVRMPLLSGTDIIFLVNYIITMWLKHSINTTGRNSVQNSGGGTIPQTNSRGERIPPDHRPCSDAYACADTGVFFGWSETPPTAVCNFSLLVDLSRALQQFGSAPEIPVRNPPLLNPGSAPATSVLYTILLTRMRLEWQGGVTVADLEGG